MKKIFLCVLLALSSPIYAYIVCPQMLVCKNQVCVGLHHFTLHSEPYIPDGRYQFYSALATIAPSLETQCDYVNFHEYAPSLIATPTVPVIPHLYASGWVTMGINNQGFYTCNSFANTCLFDNYTSNLKHKDQASNQS